ncbi:senataxin, partial [Phenoliferia sp. Uapishka_3]
MNPTASTSALPPPPPKVFTPPAQVVADLEAARRPGATDDDWQDATESSLDWLLSLRPNISLPGADVKPSIKGKEKEQEVVHWFCGRDGAEGCWQSAVFLLRLVAFKRAEDVGQWRDMLDNLLVTCCDCVQHYQRAKVEYRDRLVRYSDKVTQNFFKSLEKMERAVVMASLSTAGLSTGDLGTLAPSSADLSKAPTAVVYHCLVNFQLFQDPHIIDTLTSGLPTPTLPFPPVVSPGLLALLLHQSQVLREWAQAQLADCHLATAKEYTDNNLSEVIDAHLHVVASRDRGESTAPSNLHLDYTFQRTTFWKGISICLSTLSPDAIRANLVRRSSGNDIVSLVAGHLGDQGEHFTNVLASFRTLLESLGPHFWAVGDEKYEEVVLHAVLDNSDFESCFRQMATGTAEHGLLDWLHPFVASVAHSPDLFVNSLAIITSTFLDRFQKTRFESALRTVAIQLAVSLLGEVFVGTGKDAKYPHARKATKVMDLHSPFLAQVAFSSEFANEPWKDASGFVIAFLSKVTEQDSKRLADNIYALATYALELKDEEAKQAAAEKDKAAGKVPTTIVGKLLVAQTTAFCVQSDLFLPDIFEASTPPIPPSVTNFYKTLWNSSYELLRESDVRGNGVLLKAVAASAHLEKLSASTWSIKERIRPQMKAANDAMEAMRQPFIAHLMSLADERTDHLLDFLGLPGVAENVALILLSPVPDVHNTAQGLVKQAFDVTTRRECLRCLLFQFPDSILRGLSLGIKAFIKTARLLPEATGMAKRLVRCLSDVIDVLCAASDGLLRDAGFLARSQDSNVQGKLLSFWKLMCQALALLFKHTPSWSVYFENEQMTEWMRDAVLFGVDMLKHVRTFEGIVSGQGLKSAPTASPVKTLHTGATIIAALSDPLDELIAWLRLNDEDLLSSSFGLVCSMLERFSKSGIQVSPMTAAKIRKMSDREKKRLATNGPRSSILRDDQLRELVAALDGADPESPPPSESRASTSSSAGSSSKTVRLNGKGAIEVIQIDSDDERPARKASSLIKSSKTRVDTGRQAPSTSSLQAFKNPAMTARPPSLPTTKFPGGGKSLATGAAGKKASGPNFNVPAMKSMARPRGVPWTTYSSKPATAIDSSSSDDSSDDEKGPKLSGLAGLAKAQKSPKIKAIERRGIKIFEQDGPGFTRGVRGPNARPGREEQQAANAAKLRGVQDFTHLHRQILQWDITHDGPLPPHMTAEPLQVPHSFASPEDYFAAYEPLLLVECWEQLRQARQEATNETQPIPVDIAGRQDVDDFTDVFLTIEHGKLPDRFYLNESDLVVIRQGQRQALARVHAFGRKREFVEVTLRLHLGNDVSNASAGLVARTKWEVVKLYTLSTIHREYSALQTLRYLELCSDIISPRPPPRLDVDSRTLERTMKAYVVNEPQAKAILGSLQTRGFSLIQGPPGTGKTKTILGLIGAFIDSRPRAATAITVGKPTAPGAIAPVAKVLLCAPSNAAVDEVAKRLMAGIRDSNGTLYTPKVVRIGSDSAVDISVKPIFIDELVQQEMSGVTQGKENNSSAQNRMQGMRAEVDGLRSERDAKHAEIDALSHNDARRLEVVAELKIVKSRIFQISQQLDSEKDKAQQTKRAMDAQQRKIRLKILSEADVICSTLSGAGHDYMSQLPFDFETVIIDEAAQSIELSSLIPLKYGCKRCILVGDPLQLPPTVISRSAGRAGYDRSLFVRLMNRGPTSVHLLSIQYRMHSHISAFPSAAFYDRRLADGPDMDEKTRQVWHANPLFPPYAFMHVKGGSEVAGRHHSLSNPREASTALAIYERLLRDHPSVNFDRRIGIVTPYKGQVGELKKQFRNRFGMDILDVISFATVDTRGRRALILTADEMLNERLRRRMNVALTRARSSLFVLGDMNKLKSNQYWGNLVNDAQARGLLLQVDAATFHSTGPPPIISSTSSKASVSVAKPISIDALSPSAPSPTIPTGPTNKNTLGVKRRATELMSGPSGDSVKTKKQPTVVQQPVKPREVQDAKPLVPAAGPSAAPLNQPLNQASNPPTTQPPIIRRAAPKKPPSLFVPKKRPATGPGGGPPMKKPAP